MDDIGNPRRTGKPILLGNVRRPSAAVNCGANCNHVHGGEFHPANPSLAGHVDGVVSLCAQEEMVRSHAPSIVASMKDARASRQHIPRMEFP